MAKQGEKSEKDISEADVYAEHMKSVKPSVHWAYMSAVIVGAFVAMVVLIAIMDGLTN